ncbi:MAG: hypothetical protein CMJ64_04400 [Planctomycetaceae bacterium]|nr:hypothetical protein [Planctomycetaceae bacterium]
MFLRTLSVVLCFFCLFGGDVQAEELARFSAVVDLGPDRGQSFGSIFEARDSNGRVVAGAGFMDAYNTRFRGDRHTLQFFIRPAADDNAFAIKRLPHPDLDTGVYLFDIDEKLHAWTSVRNNSVRRWDAVSERWVGELPPEVSGLRGGDGVMRLGKGTLSFSQNKATCNGRPILAPPTEGRYYCFYYAHGRLFFYHTLRDDSRGFTKIHACDWTPSDQGVIDVSQAVTLDTKYIGETPFAWGQFKHEVLTVSNQGGVYTFDGSTWKTLLEADNTVSYQVYSMLNFHDRLLLAQYPTGNLFEYGGEKVTRIEGWPPRLPGVSKNAREAQTMSIYRGDLFVGVWPWAELWRYDRDAERWHSMGRMFTHPEITDKRTHPYEDEANEYGLVTNHWGQRITGMIPLGDSLMISTSSKGTYEWKDKYDFLTDPQRREYGAVVQMRMPGNLAAQIQWKDGPTKLEFVVKADRVSIRQDGKELAATMLSDVDVASFHDSKTTWREGVFGKFSGKLASQIAP